MYALIKCAAVGTWCPDRAPRTGGDPRQENVAERQVVSGRKLADNVTALDLEQEPQQFANQVASIDRTRRHIHNSGLGTKWIYTREGTPIARFVV